MGIPKTEKDKEFYDCALGDVNTLYGQFLLHHCGTDFETLFNGLTDITSALTKDRSGAFDNFDSSTGKMKK